MTCSAHVFTKNESRNVTNFLTNPNAFHETNVFDEKTKQ